MSYLDNLPDPHFGEINEKPVDWRAEAKDDKDEDGAPTSKTVITMLGFDPDKVDEEGNDI
jgi:hypothetical protein